jgi:hypothetical protein
MAENNNNNNNKCWRTDGNTVDANDWLGTRNNQPLRIRTNNTERMSISPDGNVGIGIGAAPIQRTLHVRGSEIHSEGWRCRILLWQPRNARSVRAGDGSR